MTLPVKPPGSWYAVVLRTAQFSLLKIGVAGAIGGGGSYPRPDLGRRCVCCDTLDVTTRQYDPSAGRFQSSALEIPICRACDEHVDKSTNLVQALAALLCAGAGGLFLSIHREAWSWAALSGALLCAIGAYFARRVLRRREMAARGHHTGLEIAALVHMVSIRTTNPRLAAEVAERNEALVHRIR